MITKIPGSINRSWFCLANWFAVGFIKVEVLDFVLDL